MTQIFKGWVYETNFILVNFFDLGSHKTHRFSYQGEIYVMCNKNNIL